MGSKIKIAQLQFPEIRLKASELHKARGYFSKEFKEFDLLHNHDLKTGKVIYRYPAIQFKIADKNFSIFSYGDKAIEIMKRIFLNSHEIRVDNKKMKIYQTNLDVNSAEIGISEEFFLYAFFSPWIALNQKNYNEYVKLDSKEEKTEKLNSILINNIISFCKFAGYTIPEKIQIKSRFCEVPVNLKSLTHIAFKGDFMANFKLPDYLGLGKSSSRGYGCIKRKM